MWDLNMVRKERWAGYAELSGVKISPTHAQRGRSSTWLYAVLLALGAPIPRVALSHSGARWLHHDCQNSEAAEGTENCPWVKNSRHSVCFREKA